MGSYLTQSIAIVRESVCGSERKNMNEKQPLMKKKDLWVLLVLLLAAAGLWWWYAQKPAGPQAVVTFTDGRASETISLDKDETYHLSGNNEIPVTLIVEDGSIRFADSKCPDHLCEGFGRISTQGQYAICIPAGVSVTVG